MNPTRLDILKAIADKPRTMHDLMNLKVGKWQLSETTMLLYAGALIEAGYVAKSNHVYSITENGKRKVAHLADESYGRICNASSPDPYTMPKWESARPGADDHRRYRSRGV